MTDHVLAALAKRRTELMAEVRKQEGALRVLLADLGHLDSTMCQFDPAYRPRPVRTSIGQRPRGSVTKALLTVLRQADGPLTVREVTLRAMVMLGRGSLDTKEVNRMVDQCRTALAKQRSHGTVAHDVSAGTALLWRVAR